MAITLRLLEPGMLAPVSALNLLIIKRA